MSERWALWLAEESSDGEAVSYAHATVCSDQQFKLVVPEAGGDNFAIYFDDKLLTSGTAAGTYLHGIAEGVHKESAPGFDYVVAVRSETSMYAGHSIEYQNSASGVRVIDYGIDGTDTVFESQKHGVDRNFIYMNEEICLFSKGCAFCEQAIIPIRFDRISGLMASSDETAIKRCDAVLTNIGSWGREGRE